MTYQDDLQWLFERHRFGMTRSLDTTRKLLEFFGNPHLSAPVVHVAGTNGKGSTCAMVAAIAQAAGYKVGLYTSPHLVDWRERIRINGNLIAEPLIAELLASVRPLAEQLQATFFEVTTALAFAAFKSETTTFNVIEVGLGGTWDSTNLVQPEVAHLTRIDLDHTEILGKTRLIIGRDKTGIWKPGAAATSSRQTAAVENMMRNRWQERRATSLRLATETLRLQPVSKKSSSFESSQKLSLKPIFDEAAEQFHSLSNIELPFTGKHQRDNLEGVLTILLALRERGFSNFTNAAIQTGLLQTHWSSRLEPLGFKPLILADVAHNPAGAEALVQALETTHLLHGGRFRVVIGLLADKDITGVLSNISRLHPVVYAATLSGARGRPSAEIVYQMKKYDCDGAAFDTPEAAFYAARTDATENDCILLTGSHYLIGALLPIFQKDNSITQ